MRILMMSHGYPPTISGVSIVVQKVSRAMMRRGHEVTVLTASDQGKPYQAVDQGVRLMRVRSVPNPFWADGPIPIVGLEDAEEAIGQFQPDVIHTHDGALLSRQLLHQGEEYGIPMMATCHFLPRFLTQYLNWGDKLEDIVEDLAWDIALRLLNPFDHLIFPTQTQMEIFLRHGLQVPSSVISNGVDRRRYFPNGAHLEPGVLETVRPESPRILYVGRLARDKEIDILIRAMSRILEETQAHLMISGQGDDRRRLERLTARLNLDDWVHFLGFIPERDLPALYRQSDVFAIASTVEVQSIPTLQAAASGLPIVAARAGALPELVREGENGFLTIPGDPSSMGDALLEIISDRDRAAQMGRESLGLARKNDEIETFSSHENMYRSLLERRALPQSLPIEYFRQSTIDS
jgi:glycosyltransferase involved in cell wall biosynthesis